MVILVYCKDVDCSRGDGQAEFWRFGTWLQQSKWEVMRFWPREHKLGYSWTDGFGEWQEDRTVGFGDYLMWRTGKKGRGKLLEALVVGLKDPVISGKDVNAFVFWQISSERQRGRGSRDLWDSTRLFQSFLKLHISAEVRERRVSSSGFDSQAPRFLPRKLTGSGMSWWGTWDQLLVKFGLIFKMGLASNWNGCQLLGMHLWIWVILIWTKCDCLVKFLFGQNHLDSSTLLQI